MSELVDQVVNGFVDPRQRQRILKLNQKTSQRKAKEIAADTRHLDTRHRFQSEIQQLRDEIVELQLFNVMLIELLKEKNGIGESEINTILERLVWQREKDEQRQASLNHSPAHHAISVGAPAQDEIRPEDLEDPDEMLYGAEEGDAADDSDALDELAAAASGKRGGSGNVLIQSREDLFCPHCEMELNDHYEECPWCYGEIEWE